jgi:hypothetical protein
MRTCTAPGCSRAHHGRGLCTTHYMRLRRNGTIRSHRPIIGDDPSRLICTIPGHVHDHLGACTVCGVPTVTGLHPNARTKLLLKRPDLTHLAP